MNLLQALKLCREHWLYMANTGSKRKLDYFDSINIYGSHIPLNECYCCEYTGQMDKDNSGCDHCPLNNYAWEHSGCLIKQSIYRQWEQTKLISERSKYATMMVQACNWAISDLSCKMYRDVIIANPINMMFDLKEMNQ
jgi:hypothetical protein